MSEFEPQSRPTIQRTTVADVPSYRRMQMDSWRETFPNEAAGISEEWVNEYADSWITPEALELSQQRIAKFLENPGEREILVAKVNGECVGMVSTSHREGNQRLEALYVDKAHHGTGLAQELYDAGTADFDPQKQITLEVVTYNERAQKFYRKNGFEIVPGSEHLFEEKLPSIVMIKPGETK